MPLERSARPLARCLRCTRHNGIPSRSISATPWRAHEETTSTTVTPSADAAPPPPPPPPAETDAVATSPVASKERQINAEQISSRKREHQLFRERKEYPIGSRRRRAALASSANIPFQELPYQCFQEARKVLKDDRADKVAEIEVLKAKIAKWSAQHVPPEREAMREKRIKSWNEHIEKLKVLADINDPLVKKKFEDGFGDMNKPIYRHLSDLKWRSHKRLVLMQRIKQMNVVPDVLPAIDPTVSMALSFGRTKVAHGDIVLAATSEKPPVLEIQSYDKGTKLVTIAVVTPDVPNVEKDGFDYRCHFLAANVRIDPTRPFVDLGKLSKKNSVVQGWLPPYSQKGAPYQRLAVFVLEQPSSVPVPGAAVKEPTFEEAVSEATSSKHTAAETTPEPSRSEATKPDEMDVEQAAPEASTIEPTSTVPQASTSDPPTKSQAGTATPSTPPPEKILDHSSQSTPQPPRHPTTPVPERLDIVAVKQDARYTSRSNFLLRSFATKYRLRPIGVDLFRAQWDETTADVMRRHGIVGHDVEFKRKRVDPLPYQRLKGERYR